MIRIAPLSMLAWLLLITVALAEPKADEKKAPKPAKPDPPIEELERQFSQNMSGATMIGRFTTDGAPADQPLKEDRYTLGNVVKLPNGKWQFETRIQYEGRDMKMPLAVDIKWAGDTPVITVTDMAVPLMGTFTARVLFFRDQYAGTWSAGDHGGLMFGRIERAGSEKPAAAAETKSDAKPDEKPTEKK